MITERDERSAGPSYRRTHSGQARPAGGFELYSWLFLRISGLVLIFLVLGHVAWVHILTPIEQVNYTFVVARWGSPFFRIWDWLLLTLALTHGLNGCRILIDDYVHGRSKRVALLSALWMVMLVFFIIGTEIIVTFQPVAAR